MDFLNENAGALIQLLVSIIGVFAIVATMTPNDADNKIAASLLKFVNLLGANVGKARNGD
jgi:hypothetical protein